MRRQEPAAHGRHFRARLSPRKELAASRAANYAPLGLQHSAATPAPDRRERVRRWLRSRRLPWVVALLAVALCSPALSGGLQTEDYAQGQAARALPWLSNLFGSPHESLWGNYKAKDFGTLPWIASPHLHIAFWRPVASLTHQIDWTLWPSQPWLMHLQSLLWLAAVVVVCAFVYRRLLEPAWVAGLAALMFAVADAHGFAVGWLANRSALVGTFFALSALLAHDAWRRRGSRAGAWLVPVCLLLGLGSNELAAGIAGYLVAHALLLDRARYRRRLGAALPWLIVLIGWAVLYKTAGYGTHGSGIYLDPLATPAAFLKKLPRRFSALLLGMFAMPTSSLWYVELAHAWAIAVGAGFLVLFAFALLPLLRRDAHARFWALGMVLSTLPACAAGTSDRLLFLPGVGGLALVAQLIGAVFDRSTELVPSGSLRIPVLALAGELCAMHVFLAPVFLPVRVLRLGPYDKVLAQARHAAYDGLRSPEQDVIVLNAPDYYFGSLLVSTRAARHEPMARHTRVLYGGLEPITVTRLDAHTLAVSAPHGFLESPFDRVYRSLREPMGAGQGLQLTRALIIVTRANARGEPTRIRVRTAQPLDKLRIIAWNGTRYVRFDLPPPGKSRIVPAFRASQLGLSLSGLCRDIRDRFRW